MIDLGFPTDKRIGLTHVGLDKHLYYWTGSTWKDMGDLALSSLALALGKNLYFSEDWKLNAADQVQADWKEYNPLSPAFIKNIPGSLAYLKDITFELLTQNGSMGSGSNQVSAGDHKHDDLNIWHPEGVLLSAPTGNKLAYTDGTITVDNWVKLKEAYLKDIPKSGIDKETDEVTIPEFDLIPPVPEVIPDPRVVENTIRYQAYGKLRVTAKSFNASLKFSSIKISDTKILNPTVEDFGRMLPYSGPSYTYLAYASDAMGTDYTLVQDPVLKFVAVLTTTEAKSDLVVNDFDTLWIDCRNLVAPYNYIAYASDNKGTNFSLTYKSTLPYMAIITRDEEIIKPAVSNFKGSWERCLGYNFVNIGYASSIKGDDFSLIYDSSLTFRAVLRSQQLPELNVDSFTGLWKEFRKPTDFTYFAYASDAYGVGFNLVTEQSHIAILNSTEEILDPVATDFYGLWDNPNAVHRYLNVVYATDDRGSNIFQFADLYPDTNFELPLDSKYTFMAVSVTEQPIEKLNSKDFIDSWVLRSEVFSYQGYAFNCTGDGFNLNKNSYLKYSIDLETIAGKNSIDSQTGEVTFDKDWLGITTVTVKAYGRSGPKEFTHTIESVDPLGSVAPTDVLCGIMEKDPTPTHRVWNITRGEVCLDDEFMYYIYAKMSMTPGELFATVVVGKEYYREKIYEGYINILMGTVAGKDANRAFSLDWGNIGTIITPALPGTTVLTKWVITSETCLLDVVGNRTGQQEVKRKKQQFNEDKKVWVDLTETDVAVITNTSACPPPAAPPPDPFRASMYVGMDYSVSGETNIAVSIGEAMDLMTPPVNGYNYLFISIPADRKYQISDGSGMNIKSSFVFVVSDNRAGYQPNTIYRKNPRFGSEDSLPFTLTIN